MNGEPDALDSLEDLSRSYEAIVASMTKSKKKTKKTDEESQDPSQVCICLDITFCYHHAYFFI